MSSENNEESFDQPNPGQATTTPGGSEFQTPDLQSQAAASGQTNSSSGAAQKDVNLDVILDVPVTISVEIGRSQIPVRDLLQYNHGSVIELDRKVGEPMDVMVNNTLIAHGEVVMVEEQFGIRLTDVISPSERVKKLK